MKTLEDIKNDYAQELGHDDWKTFLNHYGCRHPEWFEEHWDEICLRAQKAALKNAAESVKMKIKENVSELSMMDEWSEIDRSSITNEQNLIR